MNNDDTRSGMQTDRQTDRQSHTATTKGGMKRDGGTRAQMEDKATAAACVSCRRTAATLAICFVSDSRNLLRLRNRPPCPLWFSPPSFLTATAWSSPSSSCASSSSVPLIRVMKFHLTPSPPPPHTLMCSSSSVEWAAFQKMSLAAAAGSSVQNPLIERGCFAKSFLPSLLPPNHPAHWLGGQLQFLFATHPMLRICQRSFVPRGRDTPPPPPPPPPPVCVSYLFRRWRQRSARRLPALPALMPSSCRSLLGRCSLLIRRPIRAGPGYLARSLAPSPPSL